MGDFGFFMFVLALMIMFLGEPDLHSALIEHLSNEPCEAITGEKTK